MEVGLQEGLFKAKRARERAREFFGTITIIQTIILNLVFFSHEQLKETHDFVVYFP